MLAKPDTFPMDIPPLESHLPMTYRLTPGRAVGTFLAELANRRIVGSKFAKSGKIVVPAQDFCPRTGEAEFEFVEAVGTGTLTAFTKTPSGLIGLIRIDNSDVDFAHRIVDAEYSDLEIGERVEVVWDDGVSESILAIKGFKRTAETAVGVVRHLDNPAEPIEQLEYHLDLYYKHAFGPYYGRMFDEIKHNRRIMGVRSPSGEGAFLPPREVCDVTHRPTGAWTEVQQTGTVRAMSIIYLEFPGQTRKPPYIYAEIKLDGASTRLIHTVEIKDMDSAKELVKPGTRVRAVWAEQRSGALSDISHFEVIEQS